MARELPYRNRELTHEIFARWTDERGMSQSAQVGVRVGSGGANYEVMNSDRFPLEKAVIVAIPVIIRDVPHNAVLIEKFRLEVIIARSVIRNIVEAINTAMRSGVCALGVAEKKSLEKAQDYLADRNINN